MKSRCPTFACCHFHPLVLVSGWTKRSTWTSAGALANGCNGAREPQCKLLWFHKQPFSNLALKKHEKQLQHDTCQISINPSTLCTVCTAGFSFPSKETWKRHCLPNILHDTTSEFWCTDLYCMQYYTKSYYCTLVEKWKNRQPRCTPWAKRPFDIAGCLVARRNLGGKTSKLLLGMEALRLRNILKPTWA